ncbi:hypothetical protein DFAR_800010 [Desulfarculales bacterium]
MIGSEDSQDMGLVTDKKTLGASLAINYLNNKNGSGSGSLPQFLFALNKNLLDARYGDTDGITDTVA